MTLSEIVIWFAERHQQPTPKRYIKRCLGSVDHQLNHLVELGMLNCHLDFSIQQTTYSLKNYASYQKKRAA